MNRIFMPAITMLISLARKLKLLIFLFKTSIYTFLFHLKTTKMYFELPEFTLKDKHDNHLNASNLWRGNLINLELELNKNPYLVLKIPKFKSAFHLTTYDLNRYYKSQKVFNKNHYGKSFRGLIKENRGAFKPRIVDPVYLTSEARMYHLSHFSAFEHYSQESLDSYNNVIEFGGGYGGSTSLLLKLLSSSATINVIDFPAMLKLQYLYLCNVGLSDFLNPITNEGQALKNKKINLIPISYMSTLKQLKKITPPRFINCTLVFV
jgi:hypothetical protein